MTTNGGGGGGDIPPWLFLIILLVCGALFCVVVLWFCDDMGWLPHSWSFALRWLLRP